MRSRIVWASGDLVEGPNVEHKQTSSSLYCAVRLCLGAFRHVYLPWVGRKKSSSFQKFVQGQDVDDCSHDATHAFVEYREKRLGGSCFDDRLREDPEAEHSVSDHQQHHRDLTEKCSTAAAKNLQGRDMG